jgi:uncharacterized membrane protein
MKTSYYYYIALSGYFGLFFLLMLWNTVLAPSARFPIAIVLLIGVTPLLLPLRGLLNADLKSSAWAAYISLIYFIHGTGEAYSNVNERWLAVLEVIFSLLLFFGATFYVRFSKQAKKQ